jgi:hypothetical protein
MTRVWFLAGMKLFIFTTIPNCFQGPVVPVQWVPRALSQGVKWPEYVTDLSLQFSAENYLPNMAQVGTIHHFITTSPYIE